jgi:uncharacterized membrane protein
MLRSPRASRLLPIVLGSVGIVFPFLVYFGLQVLKPSVLAVVLLGLVGLRLAVDRARVPAWLWPLCWIAVAGLLAAATWAPVAAMTAYPILVSLGFAAVFGHSLVRGPSIVERIARLREPHLPDWAVTYTRHVTAVWVVFFLLNAAISTATAVSDDLQLWTLYNGVVSYVLMGTLFAGEFAVRTYLRRRQRVTS